MEDLGKLTIVASAFILFYSMIAKHMHDSYHIPDPMVMMLYGLAVGRQGLGLLQTHYVFSKTIVGYASRILLCLQTMAVSLSLPSSYLRRNKRSLFTLIVLGGFIKCALIFVILKTLSALSTPTCWAIAASLTPTDPILSSSIIRGSFARAFVPEHLRTLLAAESGINDGLGIIMLNISVEMLNSYRRILGGPAEPKGRGAADPAQGPGSLFSSTGIPLGRLVAPLWNFILSTIGTKVILSSLIGYAIGYVTRKVTRACCAVELVRSEILIVHSFVLSFLGLALMDHIGGSELICIFFIGTALNADAWYSLEGSNRKMSEIVESLFSSTFFIFIGSLIDLSRMPPRIVAIAMLIVVASRPISILLVSRFIRQLANTQEALFIGWFGPIGVGALYYCILYDRAMNTLTIDFAMCIVFISTIIHGVSVPLFTLGRKLYQLI